MIKRHLELAPLVLLCLFTGKLLIFNGWSFQEAIVLLGLAGISAIFQVKAKNEQIEAVNLRLEQQQKDLDFLKSQNDSVKATISGMKLAQSVKPVGRF